MQISLLVKPVAEIIVGTNLIYLFPPGLGIAGDYCSLPEKYTAAEKFRKLLPFIASLMVPQSFRDEREPLPDAVIEAMRAEELEDIASIYAGLAAFDKVRAGNEAMSPLMREDEETATSYLDRLFDAEAERQRLVFEKLNSL